MQKPDVFDSTKKYIFHNWSETEFRQKYANPEFNFSPNPRFSQERNKELYEDAYAKNGIKEHVVPPGGMIEVPEWLAFLMCKHFVDREFTNDVIKRYGSMRRRDNDGKANEAAEGEMLSLNSSPTRDEFEKLTIKPIKADEESPILTSLKEQIRAEVRAELAKERGDSTMTITSTNAATATTVSMTGSPVPKNKGGRPKKVIEFQGANL